MDIKQTANAIVNEVASVISETDAAQTEALVKALSEAPRIFVFGEGRSGLVARAFAMRLMQMGLEAHVVGETTTPPIGQSDLFVAVSGSGESASTVLFAEKAKASGGNVAAVVASAKSSLGGIASIVLVIPGKAKTGVGLNSIQIPGSLFEQAAFMYFDAVVAVLANKRGESYQQMSKRHANL
jgi:6-phospho-3-hexuloisomerase